MRQILRLLGWCWLLGSCLYTIVAVLCLTTSLGPELAKDRLRKSFGISWLKVEGSLVRGYRFKGLKVDSPLIKANVGELAFSYSLGAFAKDHTALINTFEASNGSITLLSGTLPPGLLAAVPQAPVAVPGLAKPVAPAASAQAAPPIRFQLKNLLLSKIRIQRAVEGKEPESLFFIDSLKLSHLALQKVNGLYSATLGTIEFKSSLASLSAKELEASADEKAGEKTLKWKDALSLIIAKEASMILDADLRMTMRGGADKDGVNVDVGALDGNLKLSYSPQEKSVQVQAQGLQPSHYLKLPMLEDLSFTFRSPADSLAKALATPFLAASMRVGKANFILEPQDPSGSVVRLFRSEQGQGALRMSGPNSPAAWIQAIQAVSSFGGARPISYSLIEAPYYTKDESLAQVVFGKGFSTLTDVEKQNLERARPVIGMETLRLADPPPLPKPRRLPASLRGAKFKSKQKRKRGS